MNCLSCRVVSCRVVSYLHKADVGGVCNTPKGDESQDDGSRSVQEEKEDRKTILVQIVIWTTGEREVRWWW